jgi:hypothetical protein
MSSMGSSDSWATDSVRDWPISAAPASGESIQRPIMANHGKRGELWQRYREGQEDQLGALGLVLNVIVLWNTIYMDAALTQLRAEGYSKMWHGYRPLTHEHINMLGRYSFVVREPVVRGELRPLRTPADDEP